MALTSGKRFSLKEALDDHQEKCNKIYKCRLVNWYEHLEFLFHVALTLPSSNRNFSTPSNRRKHERTQPHIAPVCLPYIFVTNFLLISSRPPNTISSGRKPMVISNTYCHGGRGPMPYTANIMTYVLVFLQTAF